MPPAPTTATPSLAFGAGWARTVGTPTRLVPVTAPAARTLRFRNSRRWMVRLMVGSLDQVGSNVDAGNRGLIYNQFRVAEHRVTLFRSVPCFRHCWGISVGGGPSTAWPMPTFGRDAERCPSPPTSGFARRSPPSRAWHRTRDLPPYGMSIRRTDVSPTNDFSGASAAGLTFPLPTCWTSPAERARWPCVWPATAGASWGSTAIRTCWPKHERSAPLRERVHRAGRFPFVRAGRNV